MKIKKAKLTMKAVVDYITDILPSREEMRDEIGNFIAQLLCGPKRFENRAELKKKLGSLKDALTGATEGDGILNDINRALDSFEETVGEALYGTEKNLRKARLLAVSWGLALCAMLLDGHWRALFDTVR